MGVIFLRYYPYLEMASRLYSGYNSLKDYTVSITYPYGTLMFADAMLSYNALEFMGHGESN